MIKDSENLQTKQVNYYIAKTEGAVKTIELYKNKKQFMLTFAPQNIDKFCQDIKLYDRLFIGYAPSLTNTDNAFGQGTAKAWLICQIDSVVRFCGIKDKINAEQVEALAQEIKNNYSSMKVTELMLFFSMFKGGRFGKFYGNIDPFVITSALAEYSKWLLEERSRIFKKYQSFEREKQREEWSKNTISFDEYIETLEGEEKEKMKYYNEILNN